MSLDKSTLINKEEEQETEVSYPFSVAVRFRDAAKPYSFGCYNDRIRKGDWVVVETAQGLEMGSAEADALSVEKYGLHMPTRPVIRLASETDIRSYEENVHYEQEAYRICAEEIESLGLDMNLLNAQYTLDRAKILFIYLADQRVDFRELLKHLGARLRCRIELRQIGERDKAKMVGGIGLYGMECCCRRFKNHFDIISINMAKMVAEEFTDDHPDMKIICVDPLISSLGQGYLAIKASELRAEGKTIEEVAKYIEDNRLKVHQIGVVADLKFLKQSGRVTATSAFFGNIFDVKPILISDTKGQNLAVKKIKGYKNALIETAVDVKNEAIDPASQTLFISHADCPEDAEFWKNEIMKQCTFKDCYISNIGPIVGASVGPGTMIAFYLGDEVTL